MDKAKFVPLLACTALLAGCAITSTEDLSKTSVAPILQELRKGFRMDGTLQITESYFIDDNFQIPDTSVETAKTNYEFTFVYQDNNGFTGLDRRIYKVEGEGEDKTRTYYSGENSYDAGGYAGLIWLDYDNTVARSYAYDSSGRTIPYGSNGLINPFKLVKVEDVSEAEGVYSLDHTKAEIIFSNFFSTLEGYQRDIAMDEATLDFEDETLKTASFKSLPYDSLTRQTVPNEEDHHHTAFVRTLYEADFSFSEIGTANSKDMIKPMESKAENEPLRNALANMAGKEVTLKRQVQPYVDGEYNGTDVWLNVYYMGEEEGIYSQAYELAPDQAAPSSATTSDYILKPAVAGALMSVYQLNDTTGKFQLNAANYAGLHNRYTYSDLAYDVSFLSGDVFLYNEDDGSYSPTDDNLPYIMTEVFMSPLDSFTPIDSGYVNDVRIYVNEDGTCLDKIVALYADHAGNSGTMTLHFEGLGDSHPAFDISFAS